MSGRLARLGLVAVAATPIVVLALGAVSIRWFFPQIIPAEWNLDHALQILQAPATGEALITGTVVAGLVTAIALVVGWPAARVLARPGFRWRGITLALLFLPSVVPPIGLAMGIDIGLLNLGAEGTIAAVIAAHLVPALPYAVAALAAAFFRHDDRVDQQAASLGAPPRYVLTHVTIPAMRTGLAAAAVLTFIVSWSQYLLTLLAGSGRVVTITMLLFNAVSGGNPSTIGTLALVAIVPVAILVSLVVGALEQTEGTA
jgi:putative spermidine/putrescine transport system permease protein